MSYVPDVTVEIAFGDGYSTPAGDRTWTDVSDYVEADQGIDIGFGRGDELSIADANTLSLTLDNSDGRFTAGLTTGAYYPNVRIGVPIRVTTTPDGGSPSVRFVGFVDEWPVAWDGTDSYASATISATSRLARLGLDAELRPIIEQTFALDSPIAHYPLSEAAHATRAADISGNGAHTLAVRGGGADVAFGVATGPGTDGLTAVRMTSGGKYLRTVNGPPLTFGSMTVECFFLLAAGSDGYIVYLQDRRDTSTSGSVVVDVTGGAIRATIVDQSGTLLDLPTGGFPGLDDEATHHMALTWDDATTTAKFYLNGIQVSSKSTSALTGWTTSGVDVAINPNERASGLTGMNGTFAHLALYDHALTAGQIADHAAAGLTGFDDETTDDRMVRYASFAGVPATEIDAEAGKTTCQHIDTTGGSAVDLMRLVETTEGGVLFDAADGALTFQSRAHRYVRAADLTLDMTAQTVGSDFSPKLDRFGLLNDVTASDILGAVTARSVDPTSRDYYGPSATSIETISSDDDEPEQIAAWTLATRAEPIPRVPALTLDLLTAAVQDDVLALTIGSRIDITGQPAQAADTEASYFVEGYTETITGTTYDLTFNVSPGQIWLNVPVFDDAARGFDSGVIFAY